MKGSEKSASSLEPTFHPPRFSSWLKRGRLLADKGSFSLQCHRHYIGELRWCKPSPAPGGATLAILAFERLRLSLGAIGQLTEAGCSPEGYTSCGWVSASCWRRSSPGAPSWCRPSFDSRTWCTETLWKRRGVVVLFKMKRHFTSKAKYKLKEKRYLVIFTRTWNQT